MVTVANKEYSSIRLEITSRCNINCVYCHNKDHLNREDDMKTEKIISLIHELKGKFPINKILITGGEPLLCKDIVKIVESITRLDIKADMVTNGMLLTEDMADKLIRAGLKRIRLSIDGFEEHTEYRKGSSYKQLWDIAALLVQRNDINVCIHTVCSPHNVENLYNVYEKILQIGAHRWRIFDIGYKGGVTSNKKEMNLNDYYNKFFEVSKKIIKNFITYEIHKRLNMEINNIFTSEMQKVEVDYTDIKLDDLISYRLPKSPCHYISHQLSIRSNGISTFCQFFHNEIADFRCKSVEQAFKEKKYVTENEIPLNKIEDCLNCKYILICNSGCRARASILTGNIFSADPVACFMTTRMINELVPLYPENIQQIYNFNINETGNRPKYTAYDLDSFLKKGDYLF
ncbi:radical SAM/SPASM domain-containing protein [Paenibacillus sp. BJ-4]|uniref:radical SAM/SPASM domain-containing protein n=1 Tax=Paenibacillus sp. BJ-4 TaxID=2878097 RepID=UPI001CF042FD|nr:radical SAM protein [Paenibacillus sp. BJ-4]